MQSNNEEQNAAYFTRAELEIEIARLALRLGRVASRVAPSAADMHADERHAALAEWFSELSDDIVRRTDPRHKRYAEERIGKLASACSPLAKGLSAIRAGASSAATRAPRQRRFGSDRHAHQLFGRHGAHLDGRQ